MIEIGANARPVVLDAQNGEWGTALQPIVNDSSVGTWEASYRHVKFVADIATLWFLHLGVNIFDGCWGRCLARYRGRRLTVIGLAWPRCIGLVSVGWICLLTRVGECRSIRRHHLPQRALGSAVNLRGWRARWRIFLGEIATLDHLVKASVVWKRFGFLSHCPRVERCCQYSQS